MAAEELLSIAEELYALPPGEFTGTRNQWAKQTKAAGDPALAIRVTELRKPSTAAWVVNMMVRHQADQMTQVLDLGASLRQAQDDLDADALRELTRQRRALTAAVTTQGRRLAGDLGQRVTEQVADQVQGTLHAAMVDEGAAAAVRSGLLLTHLVSTGVEGLDVGETVAVPEAIGVTARPRSRPAARRPGLAVVPDREPEASDEDRQERAARQAARREAQEALDAAVTLADEAQRRLRKARRRVTKVEARTLQTGTELDEARRRVAELEHEQEALDEASVAADEKVSRAEERYAVAQQAVQDAKAAVPDDD